MGGGRNDRKEKLGTSCLSALVGMVMLCCAPEATEAEQTKYLAHIKWPERCCCVYSHDPVESSVLVHVDNR